jgi:hypothetical protein
MDVQGVIIMGLVGLLILLVLWVVGGLFLWIITSKLFWGALIVYLVFFRGNNTS